MLLIAGLANLYFAASNGRRNEQKGVSYSRRPPFLSPVPLFSAPHPFNFPPRFRLATQAILIKRGGRWETQLVVGKGFEHAGRLMCVYYFFPSTWPLHCVSSVYSTTSSGGYDICRVWENQERLSVWIIHYFAVSAARCFFFQNTNLSLFSFPRESHKDKWIRHIPNKYQKL